MDEKKLIKGCLLALLLYVILAVAFFLICGDQLYFRVTITDMMNPERIIGEITADTVVEQRISPKADFLTNITLFGATYERQNTGFLLIHVLSEDNLLSAYRVNTADLSDNAPFTVPMNLTIPDDSNVRLQITAPESEPGNAVSLYYGDTMQASHTAVAASLQEDERVFINGEPLDGALCLSMQTRKTLWFGRHYWVFAAAGLVLLALYCLRLIKKNRLGEHSLVLNLITAFKRYRFLIKQLVSRDFKTKYKRSVLGVFWSFLNPLLTMLVQYVVFSTLFRSNIPNFALYLLIGIVCFSFFNEATSLTLTSIVGNASLITKVYVPKYLYPLTRVMSSTVNFLLSLIPLFAVVLITRTPIRWSFLLMPLPIICLFAISLGIGMALASSMVFFRDTQFLWGVISMLWMYATPIFYPESILPQKLMPIFKCNPLYHILRFIRTILMEGISPEPKAYLLMMIASFIPLALGVWVFKKTQDRFVLYI